MSAEAWQQAIDGFAEHLAESGRSAATREGYLKHVQWLADGADVGPWELTTAELERWLESRRWSAETRRKVVVSLRAFYAWASAGGRCEWAPTAGLPTAAFKRPGPSQRQVSPEWADALDGFLTHLRAGGRSVGTQGQRRWYLLRLAEVCPSPWRVTPDQLARWVANDDWAPETRRLARSTVQTFYAWAVEAGRIEESPAARLPSVRTPRRLPRPAPEDALTAALASADDRVRLALKLAAYAGLRRAEIASLRVRDLVGLPDPVAVVVTGKGSHQRRVPLHPDLSAELTRRVRQLEESGEGRGGYLFPSSHGGHLTPAHLGKLVALALPGDSWTTHTLRHRFATRAYAAQRDLRAVQELLGHSKPETTARYAQTPQDAMSAAVAGVGL